LRKLGIVGGTSWSSTALYYEHINRGVAKRLGALHSARLAIESLDLAPIAAMELSDQWDGVAAALIEAAKKLKSSGAQGLLLASNTSHKVYEEVRAAVRLPILHIAEPTADRLVADGRTRVALLGTRFTMTEGHFRDRLEARGITSPETLMVGDRVDNDIDPAQKHGFQTWLLSSTDTEKNAGNWKQLSEFLAYSV